MPRNLRHHLQKGAHAIEVAEEVYSMLHVQHMKTTTAHLCALANWPFTDMLPNAAAIQTEVVDVVHNTETCEYLASPYEHDRLTTSSPVNVCCPSSDAAGLQAHTDCLQASLSNCDRTHGLRSNVLAHPKPKAGQATSMRASYSQHQLGPFRPATEDAKKAGTAVQAMLLHG